MEIDEFPIGQTLTAVSVLEYKEDGGNLLSLDKVQLVFQDKTITLLPISDTDEVEILLETATVPAVPDTPFWCESFIGKKLMTVWVCDNDQGYRDQVIFAFEYLHPNITFVAECSSLRVFLCEPVCRVKSVTDLQYSQVF
ncbi:DUF6334 family protein [Microcoleus sp. herbarium8]|uniref:DUF6334 family protein n=1 Tax=Microcoleus sp. herbarium8 TaxID=3055436 RepID=UPI002FD38A1E